MQYAVVAALLAATAAAATVGDGVPLVYAAKPYPNPPYKGTQYNATVIAGVALNASNEWPCLTAEQYFTIPPPCAEECLRGTFKNDTVCAADDFTCHCSADGSAELDKYVIPCLAGGVGSCSGAEIGQLANFVHGGLCPYFAAKTYDEAYGKCGSYGGGDYTPPKSSSSKKDDGYSKPTSSSKAADYWPKPSSTTSSKSWSKSAEPCSTSTQTSWTKECEGPTTFWYGTKTWSVTSATTITVTDCPITWTKPISSGTWAPIEWTTPAAPASASPTWVYSATTAAPVKGTGAYTASPVEFTGAASNNKVVGAVAAVAAGAALLI